MKYAFVLIVLALVIWMLGSLIACIIEIVRHRK